MTRPFLAVALALAVGGCSPGGALRAPDRAVADRAPVALDHAALHVADLDRSVAFYARVFGLSEIPAPGDPAVIRWLNLGAAELHLIRFDGAPPPTTKAVHFALRVPDLDALVARATALGVPYSDWPGVAGAVSTRGDGVRQVYVQDPDGYWIEVNDAGHGG